MTFYIDTTDQTGGNLIASATDTSRVSLQSLVRNDTELPVTMKPVTVTGTDTTTADFSSSDTFEIIVGEYDLPPSGGTFTVSYGSATTAALDYNITENQLEAKLSTLFRSGGKSAVTVRQISAGAWRITANSDGVLVTGSVTVDADALAPGSSGNIVEADLGSATDPFKLLLVLRQNALAYSTPTTSVTNGRSGTLNLNTVEMWAFSQRVVGESFQVPFAIRRTRSSGEARVIFTAPLTVLKDNLNLGTAIPATIPSGGGGSSALSVGNSLFVDVDGSLTTGTRERFDKPYQTLAGGVAAMTPSDRLVVRPGTYAETFLPNSHAWSISNVARASHVITVTTGEDHGLSTGNLIFHTGIDASIGSPATTFDGEFKVRSTPTATSYTIAQYGTNESSACDAIGIAYYHYHFEDGAIVSPASGLAIDFSQGVGGTAASITGAGSFISTDDETVQGASNCVLIMEGRSLREINTNGAQHGCLIVTDFLKLRVVMLDSIISDAYDAVLGTCPSDCYIFAPLLLGGGTVVEAFDPISHIPQDPTSGNAIEVYPPLSGGIAVIEAGRCVSIYGSSLNFGSDGVSYAGRLIIRTGTVEGKTMGIEIKSGAAGNQNVDVYAGVITATNGAGIDDAATASTHTIRVHGARIESTYNNAAGYAVHKTGGTATLVLDGCTLVPHATANVSINSGGASRTVTCHGSKTAYAIGTGVTANGLLIDSTVL